MSERRLGSVRGQGDRAVHAHLDVTRASGKAAARRLVKESSPVPNNEMAKCRYYEPYYERHYKKKVVTSYYEPIISLIVGQCQLIVYYESIIRVRCYNNTYYKTYSAAVRERLSVADLPLLGALERVVPTQRDAAMALPYQGSLRAHSFLFLAPLEKRRHFASSTKRSKVTSLSSTFANENSSLRCCTAPMIVPAP